MGFWGPKNINIIVFGPQNPIIWVLGPLGMIKQVDLRNPEISRLHLSYITLNNPNSSPVYNALHNILYTRL